MTTLILPRLNQLQARQFSASTGAGLVSAVDFTFPLSGTQFEDCFGNIITPGVVFLGSGLPNSYNFTEFSVDPQSLNIPLQYVSGTLTAYSKFTACCTFLITSFPAGGAFFSLFAQDSATNGFALLIGGTSQKLEAWTAAGSFTGTTATSTLGINTPYHAAMTYDGANRAIYLNGVLDVQAAASFTAVSSPALTIGGDPTNTGRGIPGRIGNFRFYSRALAPEEIHALYAAGITGITSIPEELMPPWAIPVAPPAANAAWFVNANTIVQGVAS